MRVDAHQHFWDVQRFQYDWMPEGPSPLQRNYLPADLEPLLARSQFDGSVTVQATTSDGEADWLLELAGTHPFVLGVVAWVDLQSENLGARLDRLVKNPYFKGVRHPIHDEADLRWMLRPAVIEGLRELARRRIPFDLLLRPPHLSVVPELVEKVPDLRMVIDHLAKPEILRNTWVPWSDDLKVCAQHPQIFMKLSGMITEADWKSWVPEHLRPYLEHALTLFGPDRCMFGSDWPVCLQAGRWKEVLAAFTQAHGALPMALRSKLLGETAASFYNLAPQAAIASSGS